LAWTAVAAYVQRQSAFPFSLASCQHPLVFVAFASAFVVAGFVSPFVLVCSVFLFGLNRYVFPFVSTAFVLSLVLAGCVFLLFGALHVHVCCWRMLLPSLF
jgi:hypothetical protein